MQLILLGSLGLLLIVFVITYSLSEIHITLPEPMSGIPFPLFMWAIVGSAIVEESIYRLGVLGWLRRQRLSADLAVLLSAALWTLAHLEAGDLGLMRILQLLITGSVLGSLALRYGVMWSILLHMLFNAVLLTITG